VAAKAADVKMEAEAEEAVVKAADVKTEAAEAADDFLHHEVAANKEAVNKMVDP